MTIFDNKLPLATALLLIFSSGVLYQQILGSQEQIRQNAEAISATHRNFVRKDVQAERDVHIAEKLDRLFREIEELKLEIRKYRDR